MSVGLFVMWVELEVVCGRAAKEHRLCTLAMVHTVQRGALHSPALLLCILRRGVITPVARSESRTLTPLPVNVHSTTLHPSCLPLHSMLFDGHTMATHILGVNHAQAESCSVQG